MAATDGAVTLAGQSAEYWHGGYGHVNELSPTGHDLLSLHPAAFALGVVGWVFLFTCLILLLPQTLALAASVVVCLGHAWGISTWLQNHFHFGYQSVCALYILTGIALAVGIRWGWGAAPPAENDPQPVNVPPAVRWLLVAALLGVVVYLYLWPRSR